MGKLVIEEPRTLKGLLKFLRWHIRNLFKTWKRDVKAWERFWKSYETYSQVAPPEWQLERKHLYPCLHDDADETVIEPIYFYQDAWAFQKIVNKQPRLHVDVGSHHKYAAFLSKVVPVTMVDIRPLSLELDSLEFKKGSILDLPFQDGSLPSLSSLCVVEHIGLGRYGDPLDPRGSEKAIQELKRVLAPGGYLYLSVPVGDHNIVAFNAGRIFALEYLLELVYPLEIIEQRFIVGQSFQNVYEHRPMFGTTGLFELVKR